ncbi:MAG: hypothetical protein NC397_08925 [Clostridium sp.]|nr:hypothetical protein [Clostridium sp.]
MTIIENPEVLIYVQNVTGRTLKLLGKNYKNNEFVPLPFILKDTYTIQRAKQWGSDTGRDTLDGTFTGTLVGIFIKITCEIGKAHKRLTAEDVAALIALGDEEFVKCKYYDTKYRCYAVGDFYTDDMTDSISRATYSGTRHNTLPFTFVAIKKFSEGWCQ